MDTNKAPSLLVLGAVSSSVSLLTTLFFNMLATAMPITFNMPSKSTMTSLKNGKVIFTLISISNGTTPITPVTLPWMTTSPTSASSGIIPTPKNVSFPQTSTNPLFMTSKSNTPWIPFQSSPRRQSHLLRPIHCWRPPILRLICLNEIFQQQASATKDTNAALLQLLNYVATYPNNGILYQYSGMVLGVHSDAAYLNFRKSCSRADAHIILSADTPVPTRNGYVITFSQIIKFVISSASKSEIFDLFICAKSMVQLRHTLIKMGWPQPKSPIQCDNSTVVGLSNDSTIQRKT